MSTATNYHWLSKRVQFLNASRSGRRWVSPTINVQYRPHDSDDVSFGITVSKKVGNAVKRSRVKRQLRVLISDIWKEQEFSAGDYVLIARPDAWPASYAQLKKDAAWSLRRVQTVEAKPQGSAARHK